MASEFPWGSVNREQGGERGVKERTTTIECRREPVPVPAAAGAARPRLSKGNRVGGCGR